MKSTYLLFAPFLFALLASSYTLEGIFPNAGPTTGETRITIYSPEFKGMNHSDHPTPKCQIDNETPLPATWIHCIGSAQHPSDKKDQTCLNCETSEHSAGNVDVKVSINGDFKDTATISFLYYESPTLSYINPQMGWKTGGTLIEIHGDHFANLPGLGCAFGVISVPATYVSSDVVTCKAPESDISGSAIPLRVTLNNQQYTADRIHYYYASVPEISQVLPKEGSVSGGGEVWILGRQMYPFSSDEVSFENTTFARFGPDKYVNLELVNATHAKAIVPPSASPISVPVEITHNNQEWTNNGILYHYYLAPYVVRLSPNMGAVDGGTNVTVIGANVQNTSTIKCRFGSAVVDGHYINDNSAWCISPASETVGATDFGLSTEGDHYSSNNVKFLYIKKPIITNIEPKCGPTSGLTQIAVTGENFVYTGANKVSCIFGDDIHQPATVVSENLIYCDSPNLLDNFGNNVNGTEKLHFRLTLNDVEIADSNFDFSYYTMNPITFIEPKIGPIEGGTKVVVSGKDFSKSCKVLCRFATLEVTGSLNEQNNQVTCTAPAVTCPGDTVVQVTLNGQQYTNNTYDREKSTFSHYEAPVVAYALPVAFPTGGGSSIGVYGNGFLLSKNASTLPNGIVRVFYQCRFSDGATKKVLGVTNSSFFTNYYIHCNTPPMPSPSDNVIMDISPNGQTWIPVPNEKIIFYNSPEISSIEPSFGRVKENGTLTVHGKFFDCPVDEDCEIKCLYSSPNVHILTPGTRESSELVRCPIPALSRPEVTEVQVTTNGVDFTPQKANYTFYDAFVVNVEPGYVPVEGNETVKVTGLGFANTPNLKIRLENPTDGSVLLCGGSSCVFPATFVSPNELSFVMPAQKTVTLDDESKENVGFKPIDVEVSIYGDKFTDNGVQISYFQQPKVGGGSLTVSQASYQFHANAMGTLFVPIAIQVPEAIKEDDFLRKTRILCKYQVGTQQAITEGKLVQYPYPANANDVVAEKASIECTLPPISNPGNGTISVALNGVNFVGDLPVTVTPQLTINTINPQCGPIEGGTLVNLNVGGFQDSDYNSGIYFTWSSVCTDSITKDWSTAENVLTTRTPPAPHSTNGGFSLVSFAALEKVGFEDDTQSQQKVQNHFESLSEFLYYRKPIVTRIHPHGAVYTGNTPITVEGAFFFTNTKFGCTPKCKFGDTLVEAEYLSSVRLRCKAPPGTLGAVVPLTVTMNGQDQADSSETQSFSYIGLPNIQSISPTTGPATGGTMVVLTGQDFVDMSKYPAEFTCIFRPVDSSEPPKVMPASFINSTTIVCSTPGGWHAGTTTTVDISFNGVDYSSSNFKFKFYQIDKVAPLSGPSVGGSVIVFTGSGLVPAVKKGSTGCKIDNIVTNATVATAERIECVVPPASAGSDFHGRVDFYYSLDGEKWEQVLQGFNYYQQPEITKVVPKFISGTGGTLRVHGKNMRANFFGSSPTCRIDNTVVPGIFVSNTHMNCTFGEVDFNDEEDHYIQISLNGVSYTPQSEACKLNVFKVSSVKPSAGVIQGGTQLLVEGADFPEDVSPICRFGDQRGSAKTVGTRISQYQVSCPTPSSPFAQLDGETVKVPFRVSFGDQEYEHDMLNHRGLYFHYYSQPEIVDISPKQALVEDNTMITITSSIQNPFNESILLNTQGALSQPKIICKFAEFGSTPGALIAFNKIGCAVPRTKVTTPDADEKTIQLQIALNGQDFSTIAVPFKLLGTRTEDFDYENTQWYVVMALGAMILVLVFYISRKVLAYYAGNGKMSLVDEVQKSDVQNTTEVSNDPIVV